MPETPEHSSAELWSPIGGLVARERRIGLWMGRRHSTAFLYEFLRFGMKQAWACLFGGLMVGLLLGTHFFYPKHAALARYDFLLLAALTIQAALLILRFETLQEAKIIVVYHVIGTIMEVFKTSVGSWIYPEASIFHIGGVPLFSGFMYASIGSYLVRVWWLFDFHFSHHPPRWALAILSLLIYINFFSHHYILDLRWLLFTGAAVLFWQTRIYYKNWLHWRSMPLLLGLFLVALFIWFAENIGTFSGVWLYPNQYGAWAMVRLGKLGSWILLLIISYTLVTAINKPAAIGEVRRF